MHQPETRVPYRAVRRRSPYPLYSQVEHDLRERIAQGVFAIGDRLPSEQELSTLYGASRITIRHALGNLVFDGLLSREPGRGTFVRGTKVAKATRRLMSFTAEMMAFGLEVETIVLHQGIEPATAVIAERLAIAEGAPVHRVDRLRIADKKPLAVQRSKLPADRFPGLERANLARSLYDHLLEVYGAEPAEADEVIRVTSLTDKPEVAKVLEVTPDTCVFSLERLAYDDLGPIDFSESLVRGDRYRINRHLQYAPSLRLDTA